MIIPVLHYTLQYVVFQLPGSPPSRSMVLNSSSLSCGKSEEKVKILFSVSSALFFLRNLVIPELLLQNISSMLLQMEDMNQLRRDTRDLLGEAEE